MTRAEVPLPGREPEPTTRVEIARRNAGASMLDAADAIRLSTSSDDAGWASYHAQIAGVHATVANAWATLAVSAVGDLAMTPVVMLGDAGPIEETERGEIAARLDGVVDDLRGLVSELRTVPGGIGAIIDQARSITIQIEDLRESVSPRP